MFLHGKKGLGQKGKKRWHCDKFLVHLKEFEPFCMLKSPKLLLNSSPYPSSFFPSSSLSSPPTIWGIYSLVGCSLIGCIFVTYPQHHHVAWFPSSQATSGFPKTPNNLKLFCKTINWPSLRRSITKSTCSTNFGNTNGWSFNMSSWYTLLLLIE